MPEPLVSEDTDLNRLLDTVQCTPGARILYQDTVRRGGLFGFFAREVHRIAYDTAPAAPAARAGLAGRAETRSGELPSGELPSGPLESGTLESGALESGTLESGTLESGRCESDIGAFEDLLASADAFEAGANAVTHAPDGGAAEFAELLRSLSRLPEDAGPVDAAPVDAAPPEQLTRDRADATEDAAPTPRNEALASLPPKLASSATVTQLGRPDARARLEMLMQLRQIGVPVAVNPRGEAHSLYEALEDILQELPPAATPPRGPGEVLVLVGEASATLRGARSCAALLRIPEDTIGVAGLPPDCLTGRGYPYISGRAEALRLRTELARADVASIVVVATDSSECEPDDPWARELVTALAPTAVWAVVDARCKTQDSRAQLDRLDRVDALVVHSAQLSASPASVWDLDRPLALLDGRPATTFTWAGLLFQLLAGDARHRATA